MTEMMAAIRVQTIAHCMMEVGTPALNSWSFAKNLVNAFSEHIRRSKDGGDGDYDGRDGMYLSSRCRPWRTGEKIRLTTPRTRVMSAPNISQRMASELYAEP